ncbi:hypothetical protein EVG20_g4675 [Dentipellis fragilis]|uniref:Uncharacterized protein n=1 Tax=Dentipellis fragilis TaxID=205917 RepID=A0A4Y9YW19_9AGAM|nr:hypothetical protein EVG20_g4675 [Dentipellis fragilis]
MQNSGGFPDEAVAARGKQLSPHDGGAEMHHERPDSASCSVQAPEDARSKLFAKYRKLLAEYIKLLDKYKQALSDIEELLDVNSEVRHQFHELNLYSAHAGLRDMKEQSRDRDSYSTGTEARIRDMEPGDAVERLKNTEERLEDAKEQFKDRDAG